MSNNTPETNKAERMAYGQEYMVPTDFARKLEGERDEAREQIEVCRGIIERTVIARNSALSELTDLERERDEARAQVKELIYISGRAIDLAEIDVENDKFGVVSELRDGLEKIKEGAK